jgi:hypothetical protein
MSKGTSLRDRATQASPQAPAGLGHSVSIASAALLSMAEVCQTAPVELEGQTLRAVGVSLWREVSREEFPRHWDACMQVAEHFGAALALLPPGAEWRKYTDLSCSVYAASPYNAKAQVRHDGTASTPALALMAANLKMRARHAQAIEARRAETSEAGSVHESAVAESEAPDA